MNLEECRSVAEIFCERRVEIFCQFKDEQFLLPTDRKIWVIFKTSSDQPRIPWIAVSRKLASQN